MKGRGPAIAILSDQTLFRRGLSGLLRAHGLRHLSEFATSAELKTAGRSQSFDVIIVDLDHEREDTLTLVRSLRNEMLDAKIVVIGSPLRQGAADASFDAEVETPHADVPALLAATRLAGRPRRSVEAARQHRLWERITPRQRDVMRWLATGAENVAIARKLRIGERAVKAHISALLAAFDVDNRTQLALVADRAGVQPPRRARG